ncbi:MAG: cytidylate kinase family protein, partial [Acidobacteriota bacterium]
MSTARPFHVAISGQIGSGKSSVARRLAERLDAQFYSTGGIQREIAKKRGMTTLELNLFAEKNPEIDREIDGFTQALDRSDDSFVIDSRLAWNFLGRAFKVNLLVDHGVAVERIMGDRRRGTTEAYGSRQEGIEEVAARRASERRRFLEKYGVDVENPRNFDLIVDTTQASVADAVDIVHRSLLAAHDLDSDGPRHGLWLCPRTILPTRHYAEIRETAEGLRDAGGTPESVEPSGVQVMIVDGQTYLLEGLGESVDLSVDLRIL